MVVWGVGLRLVRRALFQSLPSRAEPTAGGSAVSVPACPDAMPEVVVADDVLWEVVRPPICLSVEGNISIHD